KLIYGPKFEPEEEKPDHPFVKLVKSLNLNAIKEDIRKNMFKGYFHYILKKGEENKDAIMTFFEECVLALDVVKNNPKLNEEFMKNMFKIVRSVLELDFDNLFDVLVLPE